MCFSDRIPAGNNKIVCTVREVDGTGILEEFRSHLVSPQIDGILGADGTGILEEFRSHLVSSQIDGILGADGFDYYDEKKCNNDPTFNTYIHN